MSAAKLLKDYLDKLGVQAEVKEVPVEEVNRRAPREAWGNPRYIVIARTVEGEEAVLHFNGHYDVVPGGTGWTVTEPFKPKVVDGKVYGRGACDMKGGVTSIVLALAVLAKEKVPVEAAFVPDEEIGGACGTAYMLEKGWASLKPTVIAEPSTLMNVWIGHRGAVWMKVTVKGKQAHASTPWLGLNAFEGMVMLAKRFIDEYKAMIAQRKSKYEYDDPKASSPTVTIGGRAETPGKVNMVPGLAWFTIDRRLIVEESADEVEQELRSFIAKALPEPYEVEVEVLQKMNPAITEPSSKLVSMLKDAVRRVVGVEPKTTVCSGGLDMHFYVDRGVDCVTYGPGNPELAHVADEYVEYKEVVKAAEIYVELAKLMRAS